MREHFIALSPLGVCALFTAGVFLGSREPGLILMGLLVLLIAREDASSRFIAGIYERRWLMWKRRAPAEVPEESGTIVPFTRGPAA